MKKFFGALAVFSMVVMMSFTVMAKDENIKVTINDEPVFFTQEPIMENNRVLVPIRAIAEDLLFDVNWDGNNQKVTLENFNTLLEFYIGQNFISKTITSAMSYSGYSEYEDIIIDIDVPAKIIGDRTYIPLRAISELFGAEVDWDQRTSTAEITYLLTKGDVVTFEDEFVELYVREQIMYTNIIETPDYTDYCNYDITDEVYQGDICEGVLENFTSLYLVYFNDSENNFNVETLDDITKFPNLTTLSITADKITDLSPITYKDEWDYLTIYINHYLDLTPLTEIDINDGMDLYYFNYQYYYNKEEYNTSYEDFISTIAQMYDTMQEVIDERISYDMTREEQIAQINKWITKNIDYDYREKYIKWQGDFKALVPFYTSAYDEDNNLSMEFALMYGYTICDGYSRVFENFCNLLDIPCICIYGPADNGEDGWQDHAWNIVELEDGQRLHIDTTWNAVPGNDYFLLTDRQIRKDHKWDDYTDDEIESFLDAKEEGIYY